MISAPIGYRAATGIEDGKLFHWGTGILGLGPNTPQQIGSLSDWTFVDGIYEQMLAIRDGKLYSQGYNQYGQLGLGYTNSVGFFAGLAQVGSATDWEWAASAGGSSYGIRGGKLYSWGYNFSGQLGLGDTSDRLSPTQVGSASDWQKISASGQYCLAIKG